jgi:hypothetical protein
MRDSRSSSSVATCLGFILILILIFVFIGDILFRGQTSTYVSRFYFVDALC